MLFFPYSADIHLGRLPIYTILISLLCIVIYFNQSDNEHELSQFSEQYCAQDWGRYHDLTMSKISKKDPHEVCVYIMISAQLSRDVPDYFQEIAEHSMPFDSLNREDGHQFIIDQLNIRYNDYLAKAPSYETSDLWYYPDSYHIGRMISSSFAHGDWAHLAGNLFFFFAFAASVEIIVGYIFFPIIIITLAIGTSIAYSLATASNPEALPTLGLSGVVMGMIGLFIYFIPMEKIKCFFWFLLYVRVLFIPAWILASWYIGWDIYNLYHDDGTSNVNFVAHVSGALIGYLTGLIFFRRRKQEVMSL